MHFDELETRDPGERERDLFARLPGFLASALAEVPGLAARLKDLDPAAMTTRSALTQLPVLRKSELMEYQLADPPFGGFASVAKLKGSRVFLSPGPLWEPRGVGADPAGAARAFFAAGRSQQRVSHAFSFGHLARSIESAR